MEWYVYLFAMIGGVAAGIINTLAGSGSLITLPLLIFLGLPANIANATNRVGVLFQNIVAVFSLKKSSEIKVQDTLWLIIPSVAGGIAGAYTVVNMDEKILRKVIGAVMVIILFLVIFNSEKWLREHSEEGNHHKSPGMIFLFFVAGIYGGFIQASVGIFLLSALVLLLKYNFNRANFLKNLLVLCFTIPALLIFIFHNQVNWGLGLLMATGQSIGAWLAVLFATQFKNSAIWTRRLLIIIIIISIIELLELRKIFFN
ncbi:MAG TPA: sulfite exporter TauE/SafE family protein [Bacteroidia bacterium]|nr:sulfite exporter TauE/SafE family protein [Bacteroidia bacterium]